MYWLVEVALVEVELVKTPVDGVAAPIGVFSIVPAEMVRLSATCESVAEPMSEVKLIPNVDVASCCHPPPAYEPSSIPAAVGLAIPVPPPPTPSKPESSVVNVNAPPVLVMLSAAVNPLNADDEVASVSMPVCAVPNVCASDVTPPDVERHVPLIAKQPEVISTPAKVDVAVALKRDAFNPNANVEVAVVEVAVMYATVGEVVEIKPPESLIARMPWPNAV